MGLCGSHRVEHRTLTQGEKMGRPINKRYFGANLADNIKVQFFNGTESVPGYIVKQTGSKRFICKDANGNQATCYLVDKASAELAAGEMSITIAYDNGTARQITKISAHKVTIDGVQQPWSFNPSTSDSRVQIEEAGTDDQLTSATNLEGDDVEIPAGMDRNEPLAGSGGSNNTVPGTFAAVSSFIGNYSAGGITFRDLSASALDSVSNSADGLYRRKYVGNFSTTYVHQTTPAYTLDMGFFGVRSHGPISEPAYEVDTYLSFGNRTDLANENNYAFEWKGYIQAPVTGNMRFGVTVDDDCVMWIGDPALNPANNNYLFAQSGVNRSGTDGVTVVAGKWYPIRLWFQEWAGSERFQLGASVSTGSTKYGYDGGSATPFTVAHNITTKGY
jgi:hypothetical protein